VVVVVLDACGKYPVGYAIGETENAELIREANRNALLHIKELTGKWLRPYQVQSDNFSLKALTPFFQAMTHLHTPAAVGNAKAKIIEPYFRYLNNHYCQLHMNWGGHNVTANRDNQVNSEMVDKIKGTFPDRAGVIWQIEGIMARERDLKGEQYLSALNSINEGADYTPEELTDMDRLQVMGKPLGRTNQITGQGVEKQVNGHKYLYDCFDPLFRANRSLAWQLYGDEADMTKVLAVSPDEKMRFVLEQKRVLPMDVYSTTDEDRAYRKQIENFNDARVDEIMEMHKNDSETVREILESNPLELTADNELALRLMFTRNGQQKEYLQEAKGLTTTQRTAEKGLKKAKKQEQQLAIKAEQASAKNWEQQQEAYLDSVVDFNQFK
jgi:hypothetical protein